MFNNYGHLGSRSYYSIEKGTKIYTSFASSMKSSEISMPRIDEAAILSVLMKNYCIGDRTLIKGIKRTPWMARALEDGLWQNFELPMHGNVVVGPLEASKILYRNLRQEVSEFLSGKSTVGILLSGGMDSRIVAGIVRKLQEIGDYSGNVVALTWGISESRDVIYAKKIANEFGWSFEHFELNAEVLLKNIELCAIRGAEYSPVHLHAMELVSKVKGVEGILAGSYGDSIGRGEYSGRRTNKLPGILDKHLNHFAFMSKKTEKRALITMKQVLVDSRSRFPGRDEISYREIEMQMHYMRRQLNSCMEVIDDKIPLYQMFSSPSTFGYMWSLAPESRTDDVYEHLLKVLPVVLQEIPWARTGKIYNSLSGSEADSNSSLNNKYGAWLRNELRAEIEREMLDGTLQSLGIFNEHSINHWIKRWGRGGYPKVDRLDEKMAWLASLSVFCKAYNVNKSDVVYANSFWDNISLMKADVHTRIYHAALKFK